MDRVCSQCNTWKSSDDYSNNQWFKGEGSSRCRDCVIGYYCDECNASFNHPNELKMHIQTHLPRDVVCPLCNDREFRSSANVLQHIESGGCSGAIGKRNAREEIYERADEFGLHYADGYHSYDIPEFPYICPDCDQVFRLGSQSLQHQENKHDLDPCFLSYN